MQKPNLVQVALDQDLVEKLLNGLHTGAAGKALKVVIGTDGSYHIESKELRIVIEIDSQLNVTGIQLHNEKQMAVITAQELESMRLSTLAKDVARELKNKYSPVFHSLADNIVVFSRAYGG